MTMTKKEASFRPLAGIMVLINGEVVGICPVNINRFRPLAGIMVLICYYRYKMNDGTEVSVPLRGLWFLSVFLHGRNRK